MSVKKRIQIAYELLKQTCTILEQPLKKSIQGDLSNLHIYMNTLQGCQETKQMQVMSVKILHDTFLLCLKELTKKYDLQFSIFNSSNYVQQMQQIQSLKEKEYTEQELKNLFVQYLFNKKNKQVSSMNIDDFINRYKLKVKGRQDE